MLRAVWSRKDLGRIGEDAAVRALRRRGYRILARNVRCPMGELDLVAEHAGHIVLLEVKTRTGTEYSSMHTSRGVPVRLPSTARTS